MTAWRSSWLCYRPDERKAVRLKAGTWVEPGILGSGFVGRLTTSAQDVYRTTAKAKMRRG